MNFAPIAIFAYNRPNHLSRLLNSLLENIEVEESEVNIFIDGPKNLTDSYLVEDVASVSISFRNRMNLAIHQNKVNQGLSHSILSGVDQILAEQGCIIVLEDDLQVSKYFLKFCNEGLSRYESEIRLASIQGFSPIQLKNKNATYLVRGADCWGWATWKDRWNLMERDSNVLINQFCQLKKFHEFDRKGSFPYSNMLKRESRKEVDSWAIRWHASMFIQNKLSLYPSTTLVANLGFDGSGTHSSNPLNSNLRINLNTSGEFIYPDKSEITESKEAMRKIIKFDRRNLGTYRAISPMRLIAFLRRKNILFSWN